MILLFSMHETKIIVIIKRRIGMKDLLIGMVVGVVTGYVLRKMEDDGKFNCMHAHLHNLASKTKEEAMSLKDAGLNKVEYVADRVHQAAEQEKSKK